MRKMSVIMLALMLFLVACGSDEAVQPDYTTAEFEDALNDGDNLDGKTVSITVDKFVPDSAFGYNMQAGEHLNFVSDSNPNVEEGDEVVVKVESVTSTLGSYMISYEKQ